MDEDTLYKYWNKLTIEKDDDYFFNLVYKERDLKKAKKVLESHKILNTRQLYLSKTDWVMLSDAPISSEGRKLYREYRQYLRDLPSIWSDGQIKEYKVMKFDEWKDNKPIYKSKFKVII